MKPSLKLNPIHRSLLLFLLAMVMSVVFNACQVTSTLPNRASAPTPASEVSSSPQTTSPKTALPAQQQPAINLFNAIKASHPWKIAMTVNDDKLQQTLNKQSGYWFTGWQGAQKAAKDFGVQVDLLIPPLCGAPGNDTKCVESQIRLLSDVIAKKAVDGIVISPFDSNRLVPVVEKAIATGIPVISVDNPVNSDKTLSLVIFNNFKAGQAIGDWVVKRLNGSGQVTILEGTSIQKNAIDRRNGVLAGLRSGNIDVLDSQPANWDRARAKQFTANWLNEYPKLDAILAANDDMALGAVDAIAQAKRPEVIVTGFDGTRAALISIQANQMQATVNQVPDQQVRIAIQLMIQHLEKGTTFPQTVFVPEIPIVTKENVNKYLAG